MRATVEMAMAVVAALAAPAIAGPFEVEPTRVDLGTAAKSAMLQVANHGGDALRFQVTVMAWSQDRDGIPTYTPTTDLEVFPSLFEVPANATRNLRVGTKLASGTVEKSYRVFVEELPRLRTAATPAGIQVLSRMAIPIFLTPTTVTPAVAIDALDPDGSVIVTATGTAHARATKVRAKHADGKVVEIVGWYLLPGDRRRFAVGAKCDGAKVTVEVELENATMLRKDFAAGCK